MVSNHDFYVISVKKFAISLSSEITECVRGVDKSKEVHLLIGFDEKNR